MTEPSTHADARARLLALLADPPWGRKASQPRLPVVQATPLPTEPVLHMHPADRESLLKRESVLAEKSKGHGLTDGYPTLLGLQPAGVERLNRGEPLQPGDATQAGRYLVASAHLLLMLPPEKHLLIWNSYPVSLWQNTGFHQWAMDWLLATYGTAALPGLLAYVKHVPLEGGLFMARRVECAELVEPMLQSAFHLKQPKFRLQALRWLRARPRTVLFQALPAAFSAAAGKPRDNARRGIRWLAAQGEAALVREVAQAYGPDMVAAAEALLAQDPLLVLPSRMPTLPDWLQPAALRMPRFIGGDALPEGAQAVIALMLAICKPDETYAGIELLRTACNRSSLGDLATDLFQQWLAAETPAKDGWAYQALGLLGDDDSARTLAPYLMKWPSEGASARAVAGVDVLATIGSDVALMHLDLIANKAKTAALKDKARAKIQEIADARDLTREQLADRLVPRLGLDEAGASLLDFGPRRFTLAFDETLQPFVRDEAGKRLKDLPKPAASDDEARAAEATRRFKQVKKDAKVIASQQVTRMEQAMVAGRRWSGAEFKALFLGHPVLRHLVARLAWAVYRDDAVQTAFRVAEDWTLADAEDHAFTLDDEAVVGLPHPLELPAATLGTLQKLFTDYEVLQPFRQLARETYVLGDEEAAADRLTRWAGQVFNAASVMGLQTRGWQPSGADSGGWLSELQRTLGEFTVSFRMEPGTQIGNPTLEPRQRIPAVHLRASGATEPSFAKLGVVGASEVMRDIELLARAPA